MAVEGIVDNVLGGILVVLGIGGDPEILEGSSILVVGLLVVDSINIIENLSEHISIANVILQNWILIDSFFQRMNLPQPHFIGSPGLDSW